jgi:hypothetical protein
LQPKSEDIRKLIGGSNLAVGVYNFNAIAKNYVGEDSLSITLNVNNPPYSNTKSIQFNNQDWLGGDASLLSDVLGRTGNGSGSSDAWTFSVFFKGSTATQAQTILYFGDSDGSNGGTIHLTQVNNSGNKSLRLRYGSSNNRIQVQTTQGSITPNVWHHILVSYDGGTTGSSSGDISDYYSRFKIFVDGVEPLRNNTNNNFGYSASVDADNFRVGRYTSGNYMRNGSKVDELAIWDSDQSANISDIYNSGVPFDYLTLTDKPKHWWRMGDGDTYPNIEDNGTEANCTFQMINMAVSDIVNDVP